MISLRRIFLVLLLVGVSVNADLQAMKRGRNEEPQQEEKPKPGERTGKASRKNETVDSSSAQDPAAPEDPTLLPIRRIINTSEDMIFLIEGTDEIADVRICINKKNRLLTS